MSFESLGLTPSLVQSLTEAGFVTPTPVQNQAIPRALAGEDLMVSAQTGSGKTAAFMLPSIHRLVEAQASRQSHIKVLVLTPTRELAMQVADATRSYAKGLPWLKVATAVGGMPYGAQLKILSRRVDVLVATPGRLLDYVQSGRVKLTDLEVLVLDEADRMLDMGFIEDIEAVVARTPESRQTLLFSATFESSVMKLAANMMRDPQRIEVAGQKEKHANITQCLYYADDRQHKGQLLDHILRDTDLQQAIVFTSTKRGADDLANTLADAGFASAALHGDMNQRQRNRTLGLLQKGRVQVLVATDVAARGIDVQGITHVVNYDLPMQAEDYVHRIGRTGRAGRDGQAFSLVEHNERHKVRQIERYTSQTIDIDVVPGLEPKRQPSSRRDGGKPSKSRGGRNGGGRSFDRNERSFGRSDRNDRGDRNGADRHSEGRRQGAGPGEFRRDDRFKDSDAGENRRQGAPRFDDRRSSAPRSEDRRGAPSRFEDRRSAPRFEDRTEGRGRDRDFSARRSEGFGDKNPGQHRGSGDFSQSEGRARRTRTNDERPSRSFEGAGRRSPDASRGAPPARDRGNKRPWAGAGR